MLKGQPFFEQLCLMFVYVWFVLYLFAGWFCTVVLRKGLYNYDYEESFETCISLWQSLILLRWLCVADKTLNPQNDFPCHLFGNSNHSLLSAIATRSIPLVSGMTMTRLIHFQVMNVNVKRRARTSSLKIYMEFIDSDSRYRGESVPAETPSSPIPLST